MKGVKRKKTWDEKKWRKKPRMGGMDFGLFERESAREKRKNVERRRRSEAKEQSFKWIDWILTSKAGRGSRKLLVEACFSAKYAGMEQTHTHNNQEMGVLKWFDNWQAKHEIMRSCEKLTTKSNWYKLKSRKNFERKLDLREERKKPTLTWGIERTF